MASSIFTDVTAVLLALNYVALAGQNIIIVYLSL